MKYILITGASGDIGLEILKALLRETDYKIIAMYNSSFEGIKIQSEKYPGRIISLKCDFRNDCDIKEAKKFISNFKIYSAIFCSGISKICMINKMNEADINDVLNINLKAPIELSTTVSDIMVKYKEGVIIYISSMWGIDGASCEAVYSAAKGGIISFSKALSRELGPSNIRVNTISPGFIDTKMNADISEEDRLDFIKEIPLMRAGKTDDISNLILFLISNKSEYITGANIKIDGGYI